MFDKSEVPFTHEDRQWDCRFNVPTDEYLNDIVACIKAEDSKGKFKYILVGGIEVGTRPQQVSNSVSTSHLSTSNLAGALLFTG